jgi:hypothetical protein
VLTKTFPVVGTLLGTVRRNTHGGKYGEIPHSEHCHGNFHLKFKLKSKSNSFEWVLISVYGAAQEEEKIASYRKWYKHVVQKLFPLMIGGDFNIKRSPHYKNNNRYMNK